MSLDNLPPEVLAIVMHYAGPKSLHNFMLCCKQFYGAWLTFEHAQTSESKRNGNFLKLLFGEDKKEIEIPELDLTKLVTREDYEAAFKAYNQLYFQFSKHNLEYENKKRLIIGHLQTLQKHFRRSLQTLQKHFSTFLQNNHKDTEEDTDEDTYEDSD